MKVISFSLWGDNPKYTVGALKNASLAQSIYPDWFCYFFVAKSVPQTIVNSLAQFSNVIIKPRNHDGDWSSMFWRFETCYDPLIKVSIFRDTDSRLNLREKNAVDVWLESDKTFHIMRDHPYHRVPILAGMWGARKGILKNINQLLQYWNQYPNKGRFHAEDQDFLGQIIYPIVINNSFEHSEFGISYGNQIHNFPIEREDYEFIGDVYDENNQRHPDYWKIIESVS